MFLTDVHKKHLDITLHRLSNYVYLFYGFSVRKACVSLIVQKLVFSISN